MLMFNEFQTCSHCCFHQIITVEAIIDIVQDPAQTSEPWQHPYPQTLVKFLYMQQLARQVVWTF